VAPARVDEQIAIRRAHLVNEPGRAADAPISGRSGTAQSFGSNTAALSQAGGVRRNGTGDTGGFVAQSNMFAEHQKKV
jgi:hypothetical protein